MKNNKLLIISFILLFNLSCDDNEYPTQLTESENIFELALVVDAAGAARLARALRDRGYRCLAQRLDHVVAVLYLNCSE